MDYLSVSTVLKVTRFGELDPGIPAHILEAARDRGAAVGRMIQLHAAGKLDVDALFHRDEYAPLRSFWMQYEAFLHDTGFHPTAAEVFVKHPEARVFGYLDVLGWQSGREGQMALEIKTGKRLYDSARLQAAAYAIMANVPTRIVQLMGNGAYTDCETTMGDEACFLAAAQVAHRYLGTRG